MSVLIDPPLWPAHGTAFSHLVSDSSLEELHAFAAAAGIPERAFDRDHYDVPAARHAALVAAGAEPVGAAELTRRLIAGGLRIPARERPERQDAWLRRDFDSMLPNRETLREELLGRWSEPGRHYHDRRHLAQVLRALDWLLPREFGSDPRAVAEAAVEPGGEAARVVRLAAWWHDAVYEGVAGEDERASAELARATLSPLLPAAAVTRVAELILMTSEHEAAAPDAGLLSDADLRVLARPAASYRRYVADVRRDYAHVSEPDFRQGRAAVLESLLAKDRLFVTRTGHAAWESPARRNLETELEGLRAA